MILARHTSRSGPPWGASAAPRCPPQPRRVAADERLSISPFPCLCPRLRLGDLFARHAGGDNIAGLPGILVAGRAGKV